jgi:RNA polymerase sigma factor (sigma-70 family)
MDGARPLAVAPHTPREEARFEAPVLTAEPPKPNRALTPDDARRFRAVVLVHADAAYNLALRLSRRPDVAEDIVHDAYVRALAGFAGYRGGDARSWILTIVRNRFFDWLREQRLKATASLSPPANDGDEDGWDPPDLEQDTPEQALAQKGEAGALHALIDRLPPKLREVLILREMEELSYREIAAVTESPIGSVMSRLARARGTLADAWLKREAKMSEAPS